MKYNAEVLERIDAIETRPFKGRVFRLMFGTYPPDHENIKGARWNPEDVPAIYTCIDRETCLAEIQYAVEQQPVAPKVSRTLYEVEVSLCSVVELRDRQNVRDILCTNKSFGSLTWQECS